MKKDRISKSTKHLDFLNKEVWLSPKPNNDHAINIDAGIADKLEHKTQKLKKLLNKFERKINE